MENNKFKFILLVISAVIIIPVLNSIYGLIPAAVTAVLVIAALVFLFVMLIRHPKAEEKPAEAELCSDIVSIVLEAQGKNYIINPGYEFSIEDNGQDGIASFVENGEWHIADNGEVGAAPVEITVPSDFAPEQLTILVGSGNVISNLRSAENARIDVHEGTADIRNLRANELEASVGKGRLRLDAAVVTHVSLLCGIGTLDAAFKNAEDYFNIEASCGMGSLQVGSEEFNGERRIGMIDNGSNYSMEISVGMGKAQISFGEAQEL